MYPKAEKIGLFGSHRAPGSAESLKLQRSEIDAKLVALDVPISVLPMLSLKAKQQIVLQSLIVQNTNMEEKYMRRSNKLLRVELHSGEINRNNIMAAIDTIKALINEHKDLLDNANSLVEGWTYEFLVDRYANPPIYFFH